jgi:toxin ParE1/3/4
MAYRILVSPRAQKEIENAIDYYALYSNDAPLNFITQLIISYEALILNPLYEVRYKNIRSFKLYKFPYSLFFIVDEEQYTIKILSCFHNSRNPFKRPRLLKL